MMHLGPRVTALVDGQLGRAEEERAWAHVHACPTCRAAVEREGWIKRQVAALSLSEREVASARLKGSLAKPPTGVDHRPLDPPAWTPWEAPREARARRLSSLAALGAGSVGAAMVGVIALGAAPAGTPLEDSAPTTKLPGTTRGQVRTDDATGREDQEVVDAIRTVMSAFRLDR